MCRCLPNAAASLELEKAQNCTSKMNSSTTSCISTLPLKNVMIQLDAILLRHAPHLLLQLILHAPPLGPEILPDLGKPKHHVAAPKHESEHDLPAPTAHPLAPGQVQPLLDERARRPLARNLDTINRRAEELVVPLHDAQVPPQKDELLGPLGLVAEDVADALAGLLLHLEVALRLLLFGEVGDVLACAAVAARVGAEERRRGEDVDVVDAPGLDDGLERGVVKGHERFPEEGVLAPEGGLHLDVEAVVDEDELGLAVGLAPHEDVAGMGVAVHGSDFMLVVFFPLSSGRQCKEIPPQEHLCRKEIDHGRHDLFQ